MILSELISLLRRLQIKLRMEGDSLRISAPPNTLTPELRQELAIHKTELIGFLTQATRPVSYIRTGDRPEHLPLSFAQERIWFLAQMEPDSPMYNVPLAFRLRGPLDAAALERSLTRLIERHESLRTVFDYCNGRPRQVILPAQPFHLPQIVVPDEGKAWIAAEANRSFDLTRGPLLRAALLHIAANDAVLFLNIHHIVTDGWSTSILLREISSAYQSERAALPPLFIQYADYAIWQRNWLQGETLKTQVEYFQEHLQGVPGAIEIPTDHPRPPAQTYHGETMYFPLPAILLERFKVFSNQQGVTLFMALLAAFEVLLYRYANQDMFAVGTPIANRTRAEVEDLIGFFVNTLVLRADLSGNPSFLELLERTRETCLEAYTHQDVLFEKLIDELHMERDLSRSALFQVMFILQNTPASALNLPDIDVQEIFVASSTSKFDLTFSINETPQGPVLAVEYCTDLFDSNTIKRLARHYHRLLESILADPAQKITLLPILTDAERRQILVEWNATQADYPRHACLHALFEAQVERSPQAVAVVFEDQSLTYWELNQRANYIAQRLQDAGVGPDHLVGLCMERSLEMVIGLLGVLKAGGAYVPLDPNFPADRLALMFEDSEAQVLLTQEKLLPLFRQKIPLPPATTLVCIDCGWPESPIPNPPQRSGPSNLAYVIYTSGSTGRPKGVQICHSSLVNCLTSLSRQPGISDQDTLLAITTLSFDIAGLEMYMPLIVGARLVIASREATLDGYQLASLLQRMDATIMQATPATWQLLLASGWTGKPNLRILCGGEALSQALSDELLPRCAELWNVYGPTETTIWSTFEPVRASRRLPTIGRPIANTQLYILDASQQPLPVGVPGELHIGGDGLARSYLKRPELTDEKFIPNPFSPGKIYRTGDLARYLPDGNIEFLGRIDYQVKIRGFRIELGEIETVLHQQPRVNKAVVAARPASSGEKRLVAYLILDDTISKEGIIPTLRESLKQKLPEYMVPGAFVILDQFPLTPNNKVDRKALPEPEAAALASPSESVPPETPVERLLAGIWADLFGIQQVSRTDNFFALGGDSILSIQFISRARAQGLYLTPRHVFEAQTIASLAQLAQPDAEAPVIQQAASASSYPLSPMQMVMFTASQAEPGTGLYQTQLVFEVTGSLDSPRFQAAWQKVLERHTILRTSFAWQGLAQPMQAVQPQATMAWKEEDWRNLSAINQRQQLDARLRGARQVGFDLTKPSLARFTLLRLSEDRYWFVWHYHHLLLDGWSYPILLKEALQWYADPQRSLPPALPYADYIAWLGGQNMAQAESFWREKLLGFKPPRPLLEQTSSQALDVDRYAQESLELPAPLSEQLQTLAQKKHLTLNTLCQGAWALLCHQASGENDVVFGVTVSGRSASLPSIETRAGLFINTLPLRIRISSESSWEDWLNGIFQEQTLLEQYAYTSQAHIKDWIHVAPEQPLFQSHLRFQNYPMRHNDAQCDLDVKIEPNLGRDCWHYPMNVVIIPGSMLQFFITYDRRYFESSNIRIILQNLEAVLRNFISAKPAERLSSFLTQITPGVFARGCMSHRAMDLWPSYSNNEDRL